MIPWARCVETGRVRQTDDSGLGQGLEARVYPREQILRSAFHTTSPPRHQKNMQVNKQNADKTGAMFHVRQEQFQDHFVIIVFLCL